MKNRVWKWKEWMVQLFKVNIKTKLIDIVSESIPEFRPIAKDKSEIINEERR